MTPIIIILATLAASAVADIASLQAELPKCSIECLAKGATTNGCEITDLACMCTKQEALTKTVSPCLVKAGCDLQEISDTASVVEKICVEEAASNNDTSKTDGTDAPSTTTTASSPTNTGAAAQLRTVGWLSLLGLAAAVLL